MRALPGEVVPRMKYIRPVQIDDGGDFCRKRGRENDRAVPERIEDLTSRFTSLADVEDFDYVVVRSLLPSRLSVKTLEDEIYYLSISFPAQ